MPSEPNKGDEDVSATASVPVPSISYSSPSSEDTETTSSSTIQLSCSQSTESTVTLSSPTRDSEVLKVSQTKASVECQTTEVIVISKDEYEKLLQKTANIIDIEGDLEKLKTFFLAYDPQPPKMDPDRFQEICAQAGVANLFSILNNAMSSTRMSDERQQLTKLRVLVMVVLYVMMYSRSQRANWFQLSLARTLQQFGISHQGLASLRNLGIVAHPRTMKASMLALSASHLDRVKGFFQTVIEKEQFIIFCIDDYHNIHTKHRPESKTQTQAVHTTTLLVKVFPNIQAVPNDYIHTIRITCQSC